MYGIKDAREQTRNKKQMLKYREREREQTMNLI